MPDQADELTRLQTAVETLSKQVAQLEQRMMALERGRNLTSPSSPLPVQPFPAQPISEPLIAQPPPQQLESRLGLTIVNRIGAITLAIGIVFFFKYAADNQWIGAPGRVVLGLFSGLFLIGVADWLRRRDQRVFSQGVCGCGLAILYISLYASFGYYQLVPQAGAFLAMVAACALAVVLSFRYDHPAIAALGLIGGFLTPPLLHTRDDDPWLLFPYLLLLDVFSIAVAVRRHWPILHVIAFSGTAILFIAWANAAGPAKIGAGWFFLFVFFTLFFVAAIQLLRRTEQTMPLVLLAFNAFWALISSSTLSHANDSSWIALFALALATIYLGGAYTMRDSRRLSITLYVIGHACLLDAVVREIDTLATHNVEPLARASFISESVSVFLALYAVAMIMSGVIRKLPTDRVIGLVVIGIVVAKLYFYDVWLLTRFYRVSAFVALGILLLAASYVYSRFKDKLDLLLK